MDRKKENYRKIFDLKSSELFDADAQSKLYQSILKQHRKRRYRRIMGCSAGVAAAIALFFLYFSHISGNPGLNLDIVSTARHNEAAIHPTGDIVLVSSYDGKQQPTPNVLGYHGGDSSMLLREFIAPGLPRKHQYSTVYVPYGKRQSFVLPDQSTVWLNAGSYLTFKNDMSQGTREVYLNGEGYFDIAHNGLSFIVRTKETAIKVLGTTFNVNSYEEEDNTIIELITGSIALQSTKGMFDDITMKPGERVLFDTNIKKLSINRKANGDDILWTKRQLVLQQLSIDALTRKLERVYNVKIYLDPTLRTVPVKYSGRLNIDVDIVSSLKNLYELRDYEITQIEKEVWIRKR